MCRSLLSETTLEFNEFSSDKPTEEGGQDTIFMGPGQKRTATDAASISIINAPKKNKKTIRFQKLWAIVCYLFNCKIKLYTKLREEKVYQPVVIVLDVKFSRDWNENSMSSSACFACRRVAAVNWVSQRAERFRKAPSGRSIDWPSHD